MHHQIEAKSKLKKMSVSPLSSQQQKGRVETIQHQQTKKQLEILPGRMVP